MTDTAGCQVPRWEDTSRMPVVMQHTGMAHAVMSSRHSLLRLCRRSTRAHHAGSLQQAGAVAQCGSYLGADALTQGLQVCSHCSTALQIA